MIAGTRCREERRRPVTVKTVREYQCDFCGSLVHRDALTRLGVRRMDDRPEDADNVDVCPACQPVRPVTDVILFAAKLRETGNGD